MLVSKAVMAYFYGNVTYLNGTMTHLVDNAFA